MPKSNDRGDVALLFDGWQTPAGSSSYVAYATVAWRAAQATKVTKHLFTDPAIRLARHEAIDIDQCAFRRWTANAWSPVQNMPGGCSPGSMFWSGAVARNGDLLIVNDSASKAGGWVSDDAARNVLTGSFDAKSPGPGYVFGFKGFSKGLSKGLSKGFSGGRAIHLSPRGIGAYISRASFDTLPTPSQPQGDGRSSVKNLWGLYLQ